MVSWVRGVLAKTEPALQLGREMDTDELVAYLVRHGEEWILAQRELHRPFAGRINEQTRIALGGVFEGMILDRARIRRVPVVENPPFYADLEAAGQWVPLDFREMA